VPAAAVIPAPLAYIKVVAVKKLVVELLAARVEGLTSAARAAIRLRATTAFTGLFWGAGTLL
jgi:hypothetical protein